MQARGERSASRQATCRINLAAVMAPWYTAMHTHRLDGGNGNGGLGLHSTVDVADTRASQLDRHCTEESGLMVRRVTVHLVTLNYHAGICVCVCRSLRLVEQYKTGTRGISGASRAERERERE